eukprot:1188080-Prorocentrum_minimum.AAC.1
MQEGPDRQRSGRSNFSEVAFAPPGSLPPIVTGGPGVVSIGRLATDEAAAVAVPAGGVRRSRAEVTHESARRRAVGGTRVGRGATRKLFAKEQKERAVGKVTSAPGGAGCVLALPQSVCEARSSTLCDSTLLTHFWRVSKTLS